MPPVNYSHLVFMQEIQIQQVFGNSLFVSLVTVPQILKHRLKIASFCVQEQYQTELTTHGFFLWRCPTAPTDSVFGFKLQRIRFKALTLTAGRWPTCYLFKQTCSTEHKRSSFSSASVLKRRNLVFRKWRVMLLSLRRPGRNSKNDVLDPCPDACTWKHGMFKSCCYQEVRFALRTLQVWWLFRCSANPPPGQVHLFF